MASVPAGWYPDPAEPTRVRWFDGSAWSDHVRTVLSADDAGPVRAESPAPAPAPRSAPAATGPATILAHGARRRFARH